MIAYLFVVLIGVLLSSAEAQIGTFKPGDYATFESPNVGSGNGYDYNTVPSLLLQFTFAAGAAASKGGVARVNSPFGPGGTPQNPSEAPSPNQFAFLQTGSDSRMSNMTTNLTTLAVGSTYTLDFYYSCRSDGGRYTNTTSQLRVYLDDNMIWGSAQNLTVLAGWVSVRTTFIANATNYRFTFMNFASTSNDYALLIDSVSVQAAGFTPGQYAVPAGAIHSFEFPSVNGSTYTPPTTVQPYFYNPGTSQQQPFVWTPTLGGIGLFMNLGNPFDPRGPNNSVPSGQQYGFLQTSPNGQPNKRLSHLNASISGLVIGNSYAVSLFWALRSMNGNGETNTTTQLTIRMGDIVVFTSPQNISSPGGWFPVTSSPFTATSTTMLLSLQTQALTDIDRTVLFDNVVVRAAAPPSSSSTGSVASSSSAPASSSSSTGSPASSSSAARSSSAVSSSAVSSSTGASSSATVTSSPSTTSSPAATSSPASTTSSPAASSTALPPPPVSSSARSSSAVSSSSASASSSPSVTSPSTTSSPATGSSSTGPINQSTASPSSSSSSESFDTSNFLSSIFDGNFTSSTAITDINGASSVSSSFVVVVLALLASILAL